MSEFIHESQGTVVQPTGATTPVQETSNTNTESTTNTEGSAAPKQDDNISPLRKEFNAKIEKINKEAEKSAKIEEFVKELDTPPEAKKEKEIESEKKTKKARYQERVQQLVNEKKALQAELDRINKIAKQGEITARDQITAFQIESQLNAAKTEEVEDIRDYQANRATNKEEFKENYNYYVPLMNKAFRPTLQIIRDQKEPWFALECFMNAERNGIINLNEFSKMSIPRQKNIIEKATAIAAEQRDNPSKASGTTNPPQTGSKAQQPRMASSINPTQTHQPNLKTGKTAGSTFEKLIQEKRAGLRF